MLTRSILFMALLAGCGSDGAGGNAVDAAPGTGGVDAAPATLAGEWGRGGWLTVTGQFGASSSLTITLTGTTVGGTARVNGTAPSPLTGTFDGTTLMGMFRDQTLDLTLTGGFLVGPYQGPIDAIATFVSDSAPGAPAVNPATLSGTWKSSKTTAGGSFAMTLTGGLPNPTGHITAPGLADDDASFVYNDRVLQGTANISQTHVLLFGSGTRWVGAYSNGTDLGVLDLTASP